MNLLTNLLQGQQSIMSFYIFWLLIVIGGIYLWCKALIRIIKSAKRNDDATMTIVALILLIALPPIGVIVSLVALKK